MTTVAIQPGRRATKSTRNESHGNIRGSFLLLAGRIISLLINLLVQILMVRWLAKSDYGAFAYTVSIVMLGSHIALFGQDKMVSRFVPLYQERRQMSLVSGAFLVAVTTIFLLGGMLILVVTCLPDEVLGRLIKSQQSLSLLTILIVLAPCQALDDVLEKMMAILVGARALFWRRYLAGPLLKLSAVGSLVLIQGDVLVFAIVYLVAQLLATGLSVLMLTHVLLQQGLFRDLFRWPRKLPLGELFAFSLPLLATDVALVLRTTLVTVIVEFFHGALGVAALRAVNPVARLNMTVNESFKSLFTPATARLHAREDHVAINDLYWRNTNWTTLLTFPVFAMSFAFARPITLFLFGERYADSAVALAILSLGFYVNAASGFSALSLRMAGRVRSIVVNELTAGVVAVVLSLSLIPRYAAVGGAIAACVTLLVQNILHHATLVRAGVITAFPPRSRRLYLTVFFTTAALLVLEWTLSPPLLWDFVAAAAGSYLVLRLNIRTLEIPETFPEIGRVRLIRRVLGCQAE